jgi:hypothetical protein
MKKLLTIFRLAAASTIPDSEKTRRPNPPKRKKISYVIKAIEIDGG